MEASFRARKMGPVNSLPFLALLVILAVVVPALTQEVGVIGRRKDMIKLDELRNQHVLQRSATSKIEDEEEKIDMNLIARMLRKLKQEEEDEDDEDEDQASDSAKATKGPAADGEKLIQEALKGNIDPNSEVVNLVESMLVDEGFKHNQQPSGIEKIAAKKGKVYGDTHDTHRWTKEQLEELNNNGGRKRNFLRSAKLWDEKIIPYTIDDSLANYPAYVDVINKAIKQFDDYTCLKWVPRDSAFNTASYKTYIEFFSESGCWSYVGRVFDKKQQISLEAPGCVTLPTAIHIMAHAIGQVAEPIRSDRDDHVIMKWDNLEGGRDNKNFAKYDTHNYNPYDYESVLQDSLTSFSKNGGPSMEFTDPRLNFLANSATGLMFYDIKDITDAYDCTAPCKGPNKDQPLKQCQNGGFVLHTCDCHCPEGLTGTLCETVVTDPVCGQGIIDLGDGESRNITSPYFYKWGMYPTGKNCVWLVKAPAGKHVGMTINEMDLTTKNGACDHWLEIRYNLIGQTGPRRCGKLTAPELYITSQYGNPEMMLLKFDSSFAASAPARKGFRLTVSTRGTGCLGAPCFRGVCSDTREGYLCTCDEGFTGRNCDLYLDDGDILCDFENACLFRNSPLNKYTWTRHTGPTSSNETGPSGAKSGSYYLYAETSLPVTMDTKFHFESPYIKADHRCLTFWYHMYGSSMGTLNVLRNGTQVWTISGDQGDSWHRADVPVGTAGIYYNVTFEAVKGNDFKSDIAIDDVTLTTADCGVSTQNPYIQPPTTQIPTTRATTSRGPTKWSTTIETSTGTSPTAGPTVFSCTFEPNTNCFLHNVVGRDDYNWSKRKGPTPSHSTGPDNAAEGKFYAYMEQSGYGKVKGDQAILESLPIPMPTGYVCLTFAYHMYGFHMGSLEVVFGNRTYFYLAGNMGNHWRKEKIIIESINYSTDNKIQIVGTRGNGFKGDIAIDDVRVTDGQCVVNCSDNPCGPRSVCIPDASEGYKCECLTGLTGRDCDTVSGPVNCTFEDEEFCFLFNSYADDFDWTINTGQTIIPRTGPSSASEGSRYAYIDASGQKDGSVAVLTNYYPFDAGNFFHCLVFDYYMYGYSTGSLQVLTKSSYGKTTLLFSRSGQQSSSLTDWKTAAIDIFFTTLDSIVFQANRGDIAIDNIRYIPGVCGCNAMSCLHGGSCVGTGIDVKCTCPPLFTGARCEAKLVCTFDGNIRPCFLINAFNDDMEWTFISGNTSSKNTGPSHLLDGAYAYIEATSMAKGSKAILSNVDLTLRTPGPSCLSFYYNMYGKAMGTLNVWAGDRFAIQEKVWSLSGDQGDVWNHVTVDIPSSNDLVIQFEGIIGRNFKSDMAIDTVGLFDTPCSALNTQPPTTTSAAQASTTRAPTTQASTTHAPTVRASTTLTSTTQFPTTRAPTSRAPTDWSKRIQTSTANPVTSPTAGPTVFSCTYEPDNICFLRSDISNSKSYWKREMGPTPSPGTGPDGPFEGMFYEYMDAFVIPKGEKAILESPPIPIPTGSVCLTFAYHMYGIDMGVLEVAFGNVTYFYEAGDKGNQWRKARITLREFTNYPMNDKIHFIATRGIGFRGDIAIDDIWITEGECDKVSCSDHPCSQNAVCIPDPRWGYKCECLREFTDFDCNTVIGQVNCTFEVGDACFLGDDSSVDDFDWTIGKTRSNDTGPSAASEGSRYAYIIASQGEKFGAAAALKSRYDVVAGNHCLVFDYNMYGYSMLLRVLKNSSDGTTMELFTRLGQRSSSSNEWKTEAVDLYHLTSDRIVFEAQRGWNDDGGVAIDNIRFIPGKCDCAAISCVNGGTCVDTDLGGRCLCSPLFTGAWCDSMVESNHYCTFDQDLDHDFCFLNNVINDDMDWTFSTGNTSTLQPPHSPDGAYAYIDASDSNEGSKAVLSSEAKNLNIYRPTCLSFFYNVHDITTGTLTVRAGDRSAEKKIVWTLSGDQRDVWTYVTVDIPSADDLVIQFEGTIGRSFKSDMAIDNVRLFDTPCSATTKDPMESTTHTMTTAGPSVLRCTFEPNTDCFLYNVQGSGLFDWSRANKRTPTYFTGPDVAAEGSYFAYIEASEKPQGSQAIMQGHALEMSSGSMCLTFLYHMYGSEIDSLEVQYGKGFSGNQPYFKEVGDQGDTWWRAQVTLPYIGDDAKIEFVATRGKGPLGDIAVDNIQVTDGQCGTTKDPMESTTPTMTTAGPSVLRSTTKDPMKSTTHTMTTAGPNVLRCTFEPNTDCFLYNVQGSGLFDWSRANKRTPTYFTGPDVAAEGSYFAYIEASEKPQGSQAIMQGYTLEMSSGSMCLTFLYHMYGSEIDSLEVQYGKGFSGNQPYFKEVGDQGDTWWRAQVTLPYIGDDAKIEFVATRGKGPLGDIAVDNIQVTDGQCGTTKDPMESTTPTMTTAGPSVLRSTTKDPMKSTTHTMTTAGPNVLRCTFEPNTDCFLYNVQGSGLFDWSRANKRTPTYFTGPDVAAEGSYFAYIEASEKPQGSQAIMQGYTLEMSSGSMCLTFLYHMYGSEIDTLEVQYGKGFSGNQPYFKEVGDQGDTWRRAQVTLPYIGDDAKIEFVATRGKGPLGDIAVDNIQVTDGLCASTT
ncbi:MAM and LDL-receptor class A domain-containing protein 2-like isoform X2 [Crassostrea virginica]